MLKTNSAAKTRRLWRKDTLSFTKKVQGDAGLPGGRIGVRGKNRTSIEEQPETFSIEWARYRQRAIVHGFPVLFVGGGEEGAFRPGGDELFWLHGGGPRQGPSRLPSTEARVEIWQGGLVVRHLGYNVVGGIVFVIPRLGVERRALHRLEVEHARALRTQVWGEIQAQMRRISGVRSRPPPRKDPNHERSGELPVVISRINSHCGADLAHGSGCGRLLAREYGARRGWHEQGRERCDYGDDDNHFDKSEA